ncbi:MAG: CDP-alcohol phosphatidyltransferase family protein [Parvibaculum sp.]|uniref:CDP-alcohol phosphatidyltransferase family protein n=1 Tax=Parvibaculum sp. TaxID=2024848 RepID=UPI002847FB0F|nr:CDP-alcohol phosphatidyltransferase family protein [Parvibaculum sp.]MDR3499894.1 CDP-alcohol phosphatidyltransferase family protein [Parvibaculum sp.]
MIDALIRPLIDIPLNKVGPMIARAGISANAVTVSGAVAGLAASFAIAQSDFSLGLCLVLVSRILDGLDGAVARSTQPTDFGGYLDILCDYIFYASVPLAFGLASPANLLPALILLASFILSGTSFLAYAALAEKRGLETSAQGTKSFYYMAGLAEGTETIAAFVGACLFPDWFPVIAYAFAALCLATMIGRALQARVQFPPTDSSGTI